MAKKRAPKKRADKKRGRPTLYSDALAATICKRLAKGDSLRRICQTPGMPHVDTVMGWLFDTHPKDDPRTEFSLRYAHARKAQAELYADDIIEIADDEKDDDVGDLAMSSARLARHRLRIDARKWIVSRLLPRYADKIVHEGGEKPIPIKLEGRQLARGIALILNRADPKKGKE
ncbi:hypothetical protein LCGC14_0327370 [marine sediment metagenome]